MDTYTEKSKPAEVTPFAWDPRREGWHNTRAKAY